MKNFNLQKVMHRSIRIYGEYILCHMMTVIWICIFIMFPSLGTYIYIWNFLARNLAITIFIIIYEIYVETLAYIAVRVNWAKFCGLFGGQLWCHLYDLEVRVNKAQWTNPKCTHLTANKSANWLWKQPLVVAATCTLETEKSEGMLVTEFITKFECLSFFQVL